MTQRMTTVGKPYPTYRDSGKPEIGLIPEHWKPARLASVGTFSKGAGGTKGDEVPRGLPCVRYGDLYTFHKFFVSTTRSFIAPDKVGGYTPIEYGDILFATSDVTPRNVGKSAVNLMTSPIYCGPDLIVLRPTTPINPKFFGYLLDSAYARAQKLRMQRGVTVMHIYAHQLKNLTIGIPPMDEQAAIVRYLDHADELTNRYISTKERLIALLEEQRQAAIHQDVTRGLDPNVLLKPAHLANVAMIPAHWDVKRLKSISHIRYGLGQPPREKPDGLPLIRATNVSRGRITENAMMFIDPSDVPPTRDAVLREGDIVVVRSGAYTADSAIIPKCYEGAISGYDMVVTPTRANPEFVAMALLSPYVRDDQLIVLSTRAAQPHLNAEELGDAKIVFPPRSEQDAIVQHLNARLADISDAQRRANQQISLLNEYRTRLISDVVTGQIDVRDAVPQLPK